MSVYKVTFLGDPIEVKGLQPEIGSKVPEAKLLNSRREEVQLSDVIMSQVTIVSVIPNVLTRTCELQTKHFADATKDKGYQYITVGRNTVDEFNEWNKQNELEVDTYTDAFGEFGASFGIDIELEGDERTARSVYVVDKDGVIRYSEIVSEIADEPDYESALKVAEGL